MVERNLDTVKNTLSQISVFDARLFVVVRLSNIGIKVARQAW